MEGTLVVMVSSSTHIILYYILCLLTCITCYLSCIICTKQYFVDAGGQTSPCHQSLTLTSEAKHPSVPVSPSPTSSQQPVSYINTKNLRVSVTRDTDSLVPRQSYKKLRKSRKDPLPCPRAQNLQGQSD